MHFKTSHFLCYFWINWVKLVELNIHNETKMSFFPLPKSQKGWKQCEKLNNHVPLLQYMTSHLEPVSGDMHCPVSNNRFLSVRFGLVWSRFYQLSGLRIFRCVLFIRNWEFERRSPSVFVKHIICNLDLSCIAIHINNLFDKIWKWIQFLM